MLAPEQELPADEAFQARSAGDRGQLLVERAVQEGDVAQSVRNTPVTLPSTCTWSA